MRVAQLGIQRHGLLERDSRGTRVAQPHPGGAQRVLRAGVGRIVHHERREDLDGGIVLSGHAIGGPQQDAGLRVIAIRERHRGKDGNGFIQLAQSYQAPAKCLARLGVRRAGDQNFFINAARTGVIPRAFAGQAVVHFGKDVIGICRHGHGKNGRAFRDRLLQLLLQRLDLRHQRRPVLLRLRGLTVRALRGRTLGGLRLDFGTGFQLRACLVGGQYGRRIRHQLVRVLSRLPADHLDLARAIRDPESHGVRLPVRLGGGELTVQAQRVAIAGDGSRPVFVVAGLIGQRHRCVRIRRRADDAVRILFLRERGRRREQGGRQHQAHPGPLSVCVFFHWYSMPSSFSSRAFPSRSDA